MPRITELFNPWRRTAGRPRACRLARRSRPSCEGLEGRALLSGVGGDYTLMGGQWSNAAPITFSIAPDGVSWGAGTNNINAQLDAEFGGTGWEVAIARALQTWSLAANVNFAEVGDGAYGLDASGLSQGDPRFGDIRIGGLATGSTTTIAQTYGPPPNGATGAGDVMLNTGFDFGPDSRYDFQTVVLHELGHSLGLGESPQPSSIMYSYYSGVRQGLSAYDVEGIQSLYGARLPDAYQSQGRATSAATAVDLTSTLNSAHQGSLNGLDLATIGDSEYFSVVAPAVTGATLKVQANAYGISLLSPQVSVIDPSNGATLAVGGDNTAYGDAASVSIPGAIPGHTYLIKVTGATGNDVFSAGNYSIQLGFSGGTTSTPAPTPTPTPVTTTPVAPAPQAPAIQPDRYAGDGSFATATELGPWSGLGYVTNLTMPTGKEVRVFTFEASTTGTVLLASANTTLILGDATGHQIVSGTGLIGFQNPTAGARYFLVIVSPNQQPIANFGFAINVIAPQKPFAVTPPTPVTIKVPTPASGPKPKAAVQPAAASTRKAAKVTIKHKP